MLQVIGAGFGRTGTFTLKTALEMLGAAPCYHMFELRARPDHAALWMRAADGSLTDWEDIFAEYAAAVDWPVCTFYEGLLRRYPRAKVVLTVRDAEAWYRSAAATIFQRPGLADHDPFDDTPPGRMRRRIIWDDTFGGRFSDKAHAVCVYERHNTEVRRRVPADRLLVYEVAQGWSPLVEFLGVPVPAVPFPHLNSTDDFRRRVAQPMPGTTAGGGM